jgi:aspartate carbamoyltransferase catalytic subunit
MRRDLITLNDLTETEIQALFGVAEDFLQRMTTPDHPHRIRGRDPIAQDFVLATLFYEASTRTRFSFEAAMLRLGGEVLSSADPKTTSASKGETMADTVRVVENYADLIVIRHPWEGAVRVAAEYTDVPVINAGDGGHEHPTQTLCDLFTLQREKGTLKNLNVLLWGDLKNGRTVHSLVYGLARFGARIIPMPADGLGLPDHVIHRLSRDYDCIPIDKKDMGDTRVLDELPVDVVYVTPEKPHQRSLFTDVGEVEDKHLRTRLPSNALAKIDACYVTRLQKERMSGNEAGGEYPMVDTKFLKGRRYKESSVMHPLPRVSELGYDLDDDRRAVYFKQAAYGVPIRMALIAAILKLKQGILAEEPPHRLHPVYRERTLPCPNPQCVTCQESEQRYLWPRFWIVPVANSVLLRCTFCEHEVAPALVGTVSSKTVHANTSRLESLPTDLVFFAHEDSARQAGYRLESTLSAGKNFSSK